MTLTLHDWPDLPDENGRYVCKACGQTTECCSALCSQKKVLEVLHENIENLADSVSDRFVTSMKDELRRLREKSALDTPNKADQKCKRQV